MPRYYQGTCAYCGADCDGQFCSYECLMDYKEGQADYMHDLEADSQMFEALENAKEFKNG